MKVILKATDWKETKEVWSTTFLDYQEGNVLWIDWEKRSIELGHSSEHPDIKY